MDCVSSLKISSRSQRSAVPAAEGFGNRVLRARLELGARLSPPRQITQAEVGRALDVSGVAVGTWEAGKKEPDLATIEKLATVLGVRAAWLAWGEEPMRLGNAGPGDDTTSIRPQRRA